VIIKGFFFKKNKDEDFHSHLDSKDLYLVQGWRMRHPAVESFSKMGALRACLLEAFLQDFDESNIVGNPFLQVTMSQEWVGILSIP